MLVINWAKSSHLTLRNKVRNLNTLTLPVISEHLILTQWCYWLTNIILALRSVHTKCVQFRREKVTRNWEAKSSLIQTNQRSRAQRSYNTMRSWFDLTAQRILPLKLEDQHWRKTEGQELGYLFPNKHPCYWFLSTYIWFLMCSNLECWWERSRE